VRRLRSDVQHPPSYLAPLSLSFLNLQKPGHCAGLLLYDRTAMATIEMTLVQRSEQTAFLRCRFGQHTMLIVESAIHTQLERLCQGRQDKAWQCIALSSGGVFLAPERTEPLLLKRHDDVVGRKVSPEAAGIAASLLAYGQLYFRPGMRHIRERYHQLREFVTEHDEVSTILSFIK